MIRPLFLKELDLRSFRNWTAARVTFSPGQNAIVGPNGAGKTTLLEAIHLLALGRSFRSHQDEALAQWGFSAWRVAGVLEDGRGAREMEVRWDRARGKRIRVGGRVIARLSDLVGQMPVVLFTPDELHLIKGPPQLRRSWLDRVLGQGRPSYVEMRSRMREALLQRNAALRKGGGGKDPWTLLWVKAAATVAAARHAFFQEYVPLFQGAAAHMLGTGDVDLFWHPGGFKNAKPAHAFPPDEEGWRQLLQAKIEERRGEEERRMATLVGPHRDEILFIFRGKPARLFASQGEQRSLVLALKAAEILYLREKLQRHPLALLDDIFSELDISHRERLQVILADEGQAFFTTTDPQWVPGRRETRWIWVSGGSIRTEGR